MFAKVSDKFHHRRQASNKGGPPSPSAQTSSLGRQTSNPPIQSPPQQMQSPPPPSAPVQPPKPVADTSVPMDVEGPQSAPMSSATGTPLSTTSATPQSGMGGAAPPQTQEQIQTNRNNSIEMADVSNLSIQPDGRQGSADEDRMREKAREAHEQAALDASSQTPGSRTPTNNKGTPQTIKKTAGRYALADFAIERTLGTGSFGRVHLVRSKHNGRFYAIKVLNKEKVVKMKQVEHTNSEREMLVRVRHPFLVNLWGTFQDVNNLYMVMDFVAGGELFSLLRKSQRFPNSVAKFYAAEVALALDYLHSLDIIYRDLKPENILLGADGHVKVTDFGFAKHVPDITWTLCGTPDYLAPEVVQSKGYNKSVDWYALGVLIFEMLAGYPPFFTEDGNPMKLYEKIIAGKVRYPTYFDPLAKELLKNLLIGDLTKRYGNLHAGSGDIFGHGWFAEVDWDKLYRREIPAPYVPKIDGEGDASQFDRYAEADVSSYGKTGTSQYDHLFEVQMIVFGFPSKLTALQFEWAWQNPDKSRHLRKEEQGGDEAQYMFKRDTRRNRVERKAIVAAALVRASPFVHLPLQIRCFSTATYDITSSLVRLRDSDVRLACVSEKANHALVEQVAHLPPADRNLEVTLDLGGLSNSVTPSDETGEAFLDLNDVQFRTGEAVVGKWALLNEINSSSHCNLCKREICYEVS
ncbi:unnamed protein product [Cutaneotrichosporon oleaginosum]